MNATCFDNSEGHAGDCCEQRNAGFDRKRPNMWCGHIEERLQKRVDEEINADGTPKWVGYAFWDTWAERNSFRSYWTRQNAIVIHRDWSLPIHFKGCEGIRSIIVHALRDEGLKADDQGLSYPTDSYAQREYIESVKQGNPSLRKSDVEWPYPIDLDGPINVSPSCYHHFGSSNKDCKDCTATNELLDQFWPRSMWAGL